MCGVTALVKKPVLCGERTQRIDEVFSLFPAAPAARVSGPLFVSGSRPTGWSRSPGAENLTLSRLRALSEPTSSLLSALLDQRRSHVVRTCSRSLCHPLEIGTRTVRPGGTTFSMPEYLNVTVAVDSGLC